MKNKQRFQKIVFIALIVLILLSLVAPAIFSQRLPSPNQEKLLNGLRILMWPNAASDKVTIRIRIHSGSAFDPQGKEGLVQMLADNIFPTEAAKEFFVEDLGGSLEVVSNYDFIEVNATGRSENFLTMIETLSTAVSNPTIDKETTAKLREALSKRVAAQEADPAYVADRAAARGLLGTFPYGRPEDGTPASIEKIDFADLVDVRKRFMTADNATVTIAGKFDRSLALRALRRYFGGWLKADRKTPATFRQPDDPAALMISIPSPKPEVAAIRMTTRGVARSDKEFAASILFTSILEARLKSRVPAEHSGAVFVRNSPQMLPGLITIGFAAGKAQVDPNGKVEANELVGKALNDPITETEFQAARDQFSSLWSTRDAPTCWLDADTYKIADPNLDAKAADRVTLADVAAYAEKLRKQPMVTVLVNTPPTK